MRHLTVHVRAYAVFVCLVLGSILVSCTAEGAGGKAPATGGGPAAESRKFRFTYSVALPAPPAGTGTLDVWVPLPQEDPGVQEVRNLTVDAGSGHEVTSDPDFGNRMVHVRLNGPAGATSISWSADITRYVDSGQGSLPSSPRYLAPNAHIPLDGKALVMARKVGATDEGRDLEARARRIYDDVLDAMAYDKSGTGWGQGDFEHAVTVCMGNCTDFHARFIGVARAARIPVRFTMGIPLKAGQNSYNSYHCWAHWHDGARWRPVDISEADKVADRDPAKADWYFGHLGHDRIALTFGRDITLSPAQKGEKLNYFVFPYAEADGKPMKLDKSMWRFTWKDR